MAHLFIFRFTSENVRNISKIAEVLRILLVGGTLAVALLPTPPALGQSNSLPPLITSFKASETAIVLVDFQNNFAHPEGELYSRFKAKELTQMLQNATELVRKARSLGILVIHVMEGYSSDYSEVDWTNPGTFHRNQIARNAWRIGTPQVRLYEPLRPGPQDDDILLPNRTQVSGFGGNNLDYILRARKIRNLAIGGFTLEGCAYATVLSAYDLGYHVYALKDVMLSPDPKVAELFLSRFYPKYSKVMESGDFLRRTTQAPPQ